MMKTLDDYFYQAAAKIKTAREGMQALNLSERETRVLSKFDAQWESALDLFKRCPGNSDQFLRRLFGAARVAQRLMERETTLYSRAGEPENYAWPLGQLSIHMDELWSNWMRILRGMEDVDALIANLEPEHLLRAGLRQMLADRILRN